MTEKTVDFCSAEERDRIRHAVETVERTTSGEIAIMLVDASDGYDEARTLGALLAAGLLSLILCMLTHHVTVWTFLPLQAVLYLPFHILFTRFPRLRLPLVGRKRLEEAVRDRAVRGFYEKELYRTREENGILIFISLMEHKVWILGDRGINERISPHSWSYLAGILAAGMREGRACETLCAVVAECGVELAKHFPRGADDLNELSDEIIR